METSGTSLAVGPEEETRRDRYRGCLIGLAVGDALGAPAEFVTRDDLRATYGPLGIVDFKPWGGFPPGTYTDDTQLALATAVGCVQAEQEWRHRGVRDPLSAVWRRYLAWYATQSDQRATPQPGPDVPERTGRRRRAPADAGQKRQQGLRRRDAHTAGGPGVMPGRPVRLGRQAGASHARPSQRLLACGVCGARGLRPAGRRTSPHGRRRRGGGAAHL